MPKRLALRFRTVEIRQFPTEKNFHDHRFWIEKREALNSELELAYHQETTQVEYQEHLRNRVPLLLWQMDSQKMQTSMS